MLKKASLNKELQAPRLTNGELIQQSNSIKDNHTLTQTLDAISQMVIILNRQRQIVFSNKSFNQFNRHLHDKPLLGKRLGETLDCQNAHLTEEGCGTTQRCYNCGALMAMLSANNGKNATNECTILTTNNDAYELKVTAKPVLLGTETFTIFSILDISAEKRKENLERIFIHDLMNSAGGIAGLAAVLPEIDDAAEQKEIAQNIEEATNQLIEEIKAQRLLFSAERGELQPVYSEVDSLMLLTSMRNHYLNHQINPGKAISLHPHSTSTVLETDVVILKRILGNMIKNALEVNLPGDEITLRCYQSKSSIRFSVHNKSYIPKEIQSELFKRTFTTKGKGRGLGTYSMKLLGEKYLGGTVWFTSTPSSGTHFYIELPHN